MRLTWQDVAGDLPEPDMPVPQQGWATRLFSSSLVLKDMEERGRLERVARTLRQNGVFVALRGPGGRPVACRLVGLEGQLRVVLDFEVAEAGDAAFGERGLVAV
ncbi:hypothetical protein [Pedomonas sp. V897]|uniref:hypothetical protein n=1 Tax=Pedomonas sp. V897 TaxID=3446482 RepID=UPI003EE39066